jgi:hypothetical protein
MKARLTHFTSFKEVRAKDITVIDGAQDIHSPSPFIVHLSKTVRVSNKPIMHIPKTAFSTVCKGSFISEQNVSKEIAIVLRLINCKLTKI